MDTVTYPHESVQRSIAEHFSSFKVNMLERHPDFKEACAGGRVMWGPTFIVADGRGREIRRWVGWLPPASFVAELDFCRALGRFNSGSFAEALRGFTHLVETAGGVDIHPEAMYWQGIAGFMAGKQDWAILKQAWSALAETYPGNRFGTHASVIEDAD